MTTYIFIIFDLWIVVPDMVTTQVKTWLFGTIFDTEHKYFETKNFQKMISIWFTVLIWIKNLKTQILECEREKWWNGEGDTP